MATTSLDAIHMRSSDLIKKERLDYGGFGEVYLCYHKTLGHVVLKSVFTGSVRNEGSKRSLMEEGTLMTRLCHERVVKLLGVIMEEQDYSLVMELIPKGNLQAMLQKVQVPTSIKGRITLEILEGMVYLTENQVIHKDLKPENILVDKDFHIKIADLGLATCQAWSKLTRDESRRKSRGGSGCAVDNRGAGTLTYMAPEHLEDINARSTEKSDVYSFAIVLWVIISGQDPYENAINETHINSCVRNGHRPAMDLIAEDTPKEMVELMKSCWQQDPQNRPTFAKNLEELIERDSVRLRELYEGPEGLTEKMRSLLILPPEMSTDGPAPLLSSDRTPTPGPVEASIEDLHFLSCMTSVEEPGGHIQADAKVVAGDGSGSGATLEQKLDMELKYHKNGSYTYVSQPDSARACQPDDATSSQPRRAVSDHAGWQSTGDHHYHHAPLSSVRPAPGEPSENSCFRPTSSLYSMESSVPYDTDRRPVLSTTYSAPSLGEQLLPSQASSYDRQKSCPVYPVWETKETLAHDLATGLRFASCKIAPLQDSGSQGLFINNSSAIQIGNNNSLSIRGSDSGLGVTTSSALKEALQKYEHLTVTEEHLDLLRDNIGSNWRHCGRRLGLTNVEVDALDHDYSRDGLQEKVHQMLERWRMKEGSVGCTVGKLCQALDGRISVDVIQKLLYACVNTSRSFS
ncbi:hypothetical protein NHX12_003630 [Muraenolepis orangiensis]|uniref:Receptor-interacting serine/threonine-protein kinase 1 n=1 Tax=Muraenolepis orangiensis TaxID=630683 RepID=A0A9Q0DTX2_9TELE|nr:hypothetical protein NHX12_003630 [Muraenolepis orangiensis]